MMRAVVTWPPGLQSVCDHHHGILAWVVAVFAMIPPPQMRMAVLSWRFCCNGAGPEPVPVVAGHGAVMAS